jgi:hypothetical protein
MTDIPGGTGGSVASDPSASSTSTANQEAAATANESGALAAAATPGVTDTGGAFPTSLNPDLVDPNHTYGMTSESWWNGLRTFLTNLQKAYADWQRESAQARLPRGTVDLPMQGKQRVGSLGEDIVNLGKSISDALPFGELYGDHSQAPSLGRLAHDVRGAVSGPGRPGPTEAEAGQPQSFAADLQKLRESAQAIGITIPKNITNLYQLSQLKLSPAIRQELTTAGFNPMAMGNLGTVAQQAIPTTQGEVPVTATSLYNQFVRDWGNGQNSFATQWTQDLAAAGLLDPAAITNHVGAAEAVGYAYQALLGEAQKANKTPAQELADLQGAPGNTSNMVDTGMAVDAQEAAKAAYYSYGISPSTSTIENIVTQTLGSGLSSPYEIERQATALATQQALQWAKTMYPSVAGQLNENNTLKDVVAPFLNTAGQMLGINPDSIDLTDPKWQKAVNGGANGGQMTMDEWAKTIASDPRYGYQNSQAAKDSASSVAESIRNMFGLQGASAAADWNYSPSYQGG